MLQFHDNAAKRIPPLCYSKLSLNFSAFSGFEPFLTELLSIRGYVIRPFPKMRSVDVDTMFLAVSEVFSRPENRVRQNARRIMAISPPIGFNGCLLCGAFVESIPSQSLDSEIAVDNAHFYLGAKFDRCVLLSPDDWPYPWLT